MALSKQINCKGAKMLGNYLCCAITTDVNILSVVKNLVNGLPALADNRMFM